ncbi:MAG: hypothetical protein JNM63_04360, partial [Spirochaetia bacterium]|nr:hypothetical protein [Spirochaetia bacterium]
IFLLSAKSETSLKSYAGVIAAFVKKNLAVSLADLCRLSQLGREAFEYRLAFRAETTQDLISKLEAFGRGENVAGAFSGHIPSTQKATPLPDDIQKSFSSAQSNGSDAAYGRFLSEQLLGFWSKGANIPWDHFYSGKARTKFSIPTYPYTKKRYWITDVAGERDSKTVTPQSAAVKTPVAPSTIKTPAPQVRIAPIAMPAKMSTPVPTPKPVSAAPGKTPIAKAGSLAASPGISAIENILREKSAGVLYLEPDQIETSKPFVELGLDSILAVEIINAVNKELGIRLQATKLYDYPTIEQLAAYIDSVYGELAAQGAEGESTSAPASHTPAPVKIQTIAPVPTVPAPRAPTPITPAPRPAPIAPVAAPKPISPAVPRP